jgi:predicted permease
METLIQDVRYGLRMLWKSPGFTTVAVTMLALSIGVNTAMFSVVYGVLLRPLPYPEADRMVHIEWHTHTGELGNTSLDGPQVDFLTKQAGPFDSVAAVSYTGYVNFMGGETPQSARSQLVSKDYFRVLGISPQLGRSFTSDEDRAGGPGAVVLSHAFWQSTFGGNAQVLGRTARINDRAYIVLGVMPAGFHSYPEADLWIALQLDPRDTAYEGANYDVVARLKAGMARRKAQSEMDVLSSQFRHVHPAPSGTSLVERELVFFLTPYLDSIVGDVRRSLVMLQSAVALVLLIGCANVAGMLLARGLGRSREIAVRAALGATRGRLVRLFLTENLLLSFIAGGLGVLLARLILPLLLRISPAQLPRSTGVHVDASAILFTVATSLTAAILFGLAPVALLLRSRESLNLREEPRASSPGRLQTRSLRALIVGQVALALVLLAGADLLLETFLRIRAVPLGFETRNLIAFQVAFSSDHYRTTAAQDQFIQQTVSRLRALPGVESVAFASGLPLQQGMNFPVFPAGRRDEVRSAEYRAVSSDYLRTFGIPLLAGRPLGKEDTRISERVVVINQTMAHSWWPDSNPVGQVVYAMGQETPLKIVGIAGDIHDRTLDRPPQPMAIVPLAQVPDLITAIDNRVFAGSFVLRVTGRTDLAAAVRDAVQSVDPELPIVAVMPMSDVVHASMIQPQFYAVLVGTFGVFALLLAGIGLYGLISYEVARRSHEIGVRMALGARHGQVLMLVLRRGIVLVATGSLIGIVGALAVTRFLASMLFGIQPTNVMTFITAVLLLFAIGFLATLLPARRATKIDPLVALRHE